MSAAASAELQAKGRAERHRETVRRTYARLFADAVIRLDAAAKISEKEKKAREERRRLVVEAFLK